MDFENTIHELEKKIDTLRDAPEKDVEALKKQLQKLLENRKRTPWEKVCVARHKDRPRLEDYLDNFTNIFEINGDRRIKNDTAINTYICKFNNRSVAVIGNSKGKDLKSNIENNFGMASPSGYYKAIRLMNIAEKFNLPIISLIDTPGAAAASEAEQYGQHIAIAQCISKSLSLTVPIISIVIGEGGSGGALALATSDRVLMLENAIYSVISPEGCASILWRDSSFKEVSAERLKLTAQDLLSLGLIDRIIPEPAGGAHKNVIEMKNIFNEILSEELKFISEQDVFDKETKFLNF